VVADLRGYKIVTTYLVIPVKIIQDRLDINTHNIVLTHCCVKPEHDVDVLEVYGYYRVFFSR